MLLPPNDPKKKYKKNKKSPNKTTTEKSIPPKLVKLAQKLQNTIDHISSSESVNTSNNQNDINDDNDITSLDAQEVLSPQKTSSQIPNSLSPQIKKKVRKMYNLNIQNFESIEDLDDYMRTVSLKFKKTHNNDVNCSACKLNHDNHKMSQIYFICQCKESECSLGWRAVHCCKVDSMWCLYQSGVLHDIPKDYKKKMRADGKKIPHAQGITLSIQKIFKSWLKKDDMMTANKLLIKLTEKRRRNNNKNRLNRTEKYNFDRKLLPSLKQVKYKDEQSFLNDFYFILLIIQLSVKISFLCIEWLTIQIHWTQSKN